MVILRRFRKAEKLMKKKKRDQVLDTGIGLESLPYLYKSSSVLTFFNKKLKFEENLITKCEEDGKIRCRN